VDQHTLGSAIDLNDFDQFVHKAAPGLSVAHDVLEFFIQEFDGLTPVNGSGDCGKAQR
jgi:hypothetical protein